MKVGILGGGFGLYGYMPAFVGLGMKVFTLNRYKQQIQGRTELNGILERVNFLSTEEEIVGSTDVIVVARNPSSQEKFVKGIEKSFTHLFLEKPMASSLKEHEECLERLIYLKQNFSIAYLFKYCDWWGKAKNALDSRNNSSVAIHWVVPEPANNWKSINSEGGGIGCYYATHLIPLIHDLGFEFEIQDFLDDSNLSIVARNLTGSTLKIEISRAANQNFMIYEEIGLLKNRIYEAKTPFGEIGRKGVADARVPVLMNYISDKLSNSTLLTEYSIERQILRFRRQLVS